MSWMGVRRGETPPSNPPPLRYPLSQRSHKWICQLMFQGPEQQMISSSKAKDKASKSSVFLLRKAEEKRKETCVTLVLARRRVGVREQTLSRAIFPPRSRFARLFGLADHCMRWKSTLEDVDPAGHELNEFWGFFFLLLLRIHLTYAEACSKSLWKPHVVRSTVLQRQGVKQIKLKAEPQLMADLFASICRECSFIPQRRLFPGLCGNKLPSDHIAARTKIIGGLSAALEVNMQCVSSRSSSFLCPL